MALGVSKRKSGWQFVARCHSTRHWQRLQPCHCLEQQVGPMNQKKMRGAEVVRGNLCWHTQIETAQAPIGDGCFVEEVQGMTGETRQIFLDLNADIDITNWTTAVG